MIMQKLNKIVEEYGVEIKEVYATSDFMELQISTENLAIKKDDDIQEAKKTLIKRNEVINELLKIHNVKSVDFEQYITFQDFTVKLINPLEVNEDSLINYTPYLFKLNICKA